jgi:thiamine-monophosphate kinase
VWVSGELGAAALALVHPEIPSAAAKLHEPEPRVELGERLRGLARAAIDVSDGLVGDLQHILNRSRVGAVVHYDAIPRAEAFQALNDAKLEKDCVLSGGDDYELLFTVSRDRRKEVESLSRELAIALTRIGSIRTGEPKLVVMDGEHKPMSFRGGFDHFAGR